jgi:hypothetical protein
MTHDTDDAAVTNPYVRVHRESCHRGVGCVMRHCPSPTGEGASPSRQRPADVRVVTG